MSEPGARAAPRSGRALAFAACLPALLVLVVFRGALDGGILAWDDATLLLRETRWRGLGAENVLFDLRDAHGARLGPWQPLVWLSWSATYAAAGMNAAVHHAVNVALHALTTALLAIVGARIGRLSGLSPTRAVLAGGLAATLFGLHPLRVEPVAWLTARRDVLSGLLVVVSVLAWLRRDVAPLPAVRRRWWAVSWGAFALAMTAKAAVVGLPLVLLLLDVSLLRRRPQVRALVPFVLVGAVVAAISMGGQDDVGALADVPPAERLLLAGHSVWFTLSRSLAPLGLRAHYLRPDPVSFTDLRLLLPTIGVALVTAVLAVRARRLPGTATTWFAVLVLLAPVSGLVPVGKHLTADRYTYLPGAVLSVAAVVALLRAAGSRRGGVATTVVGTAALCAAFAGMSIALVPTWRDTGALFARVLEHEPDNWLARAHVADFAAEQGDHGRARREWERVVAVQPDAPFVTGLAWACVRTGDLPAAGDVVRDARRRFPADPDVLEVHAVHASLTGDGRGGAETLRRAIEADPRRASLRFNLGVVLEGLGERAAAREAFAEALRLDPGHERARARLGGF